MNKGLIAALAVAIAVGAIILINLSGDDGPEEQSGGQDQTIAAAPEPDATTETPDADATADATTETPEADAVVETTTETPEADAVAEATTETPEADRASPTNDKRSLSTVRFKALARISYDTLEEVVIAAVEGGKMTKDLALLIGPDQPWQTSEQFLATLAYNLKKSLA